MRNGKNILMSITNLGKVLDKLRSKRFPAFSVSTYDISTLNATLPHNIIKEKFNELIRNTLYREGSLYLACLPLGNFWRLLFLFLFMLTIFGICFPPLGYLLLSHLLLGSVYLTTNAFKNVECILMFLIAIQRSVSVAHINVLVLHYQFQLTEQHLILFML